MNTYILQKDTPTAKAGTKYIQKDPQLTDFYFSDTGNYRPEVVENNPEWFLKEPKKTISVTGIGGIGVLSASINADWLAATIVQHIYIFIKSDRDIPSFKKVKEWVLENVPEAK